MSAMAEMLALRIGLVFGVDSHSSGNSVRWAGDNNWPVKCKLRDGVVAAIVHGYRGYSTLALNQGVCKVPSFNRVCVHVVTVFSHGYFAASASSISTPRPGLSFA